MLKFSQFLHETLEDDGEMHPYLQFLTSNHGIPDDSSLHENSDDILTKVKIHNDAVKDGYASAMNKIKNKDPRVLTKAPKGYYFTSSHKLVATKKTNDIDDILTKVKIHNDAVKDGYASAMNKIKNKDPRVLTKAPKGYYFTSSHKLVAESIIPIHQINRIGKNPLRAVKQAFDHIGNGNNPHTGEPLPPYGSKEYKKLVADAHARLREKHGVDPKNLLAGNKKLQDSTGEHILDKHGKQIYSQGLSLSPADDRYGINTCPKASAECKSACLAHTSGAMARAKATQDAKKRKTDALFNSPEDMAIALHHHISKEEKAANKDGTYSYSVRMNVTSDIPQTVYHGLRKAHPNTQFYDYTKEHKQVLHNLKHKDEPGHKNLHLTFSSTGVHHEESNWEHCREVLRAGGNVAIVSRSKNAIKGKAQTSANELPHTVHDTDTGEKWPTLDGDGRSHDLDGHGDARFLDKPGHVVMLHLKGVNPKKAGNFAVPHGPDRIAYVSASKSKK